MINFPFGIWQRLRHPTPMIETRITQRPVTTFGVCLATSVYCEQALMTRLYDTSAYDTTTRTNEGEPSRDPAEKF